MEGDEIAEAVPLFKWPETKSELLRSLILKEPSEIRVRTASHLQTNGFVIQDSLSPVQVHELLNLAAIILATLAGSAGKLEDLERQFGVLADAALRVQRHLTR